MTDVIVIGGGASGMMAALTAAENGRSVVLLERQSRVGRKLLATGNGPVQSDQLPCISRSLPWGGQQFLRSRAVRL